MSKTTIIFLLTSILALTGEAINQTKLEKKDSSAICALTGLCQGTLIKGYDNLSKDECLYRCDDDKSCNWWSFSKTESRCQTYEDCPELDENYLNYISGQDDCYNHYPYGCKGPKNVYLNETCYYVEKTLLGFGEAIANCKETLRNGRLFEPRDKTTHDSVLAAALGIIRHYYWLGINDALSEGQFQYLSGGNLTFSNWNTGESNNSGNTDCAVVRWNGRWNAVRCNVNVYGSICEVGEA